MSNEVGLRLKELRQKLKMTQVQLGEKLGIKGTTLAKHENGICYPTGKMLNILSSQYNVSMDYLLCGRGTLFHEDKDNSDSNRLKNIVKGDTKYGDRRKFGHYLPRAGFDRRFLPVP